MELELADGWIEGELAKEFPQRGLVHAPLEARPGRSPLEVKQRLRQLANRYTGGHVIHMRQDAVPWAYRVFARQVGIDPDTDRTPVEAMPATMGLLVCRIGGPGRRPAEAVCG